MDLETQKKVAAKFDELGSEVLNPVYEALNGDVPYGHLKVVRAFAVYGSLPN